MSEFVNRLDPCDPTPGGDGPGEQATFRNAAPPGGFPVVAGIDPERAAESADQDPAFFLELLASFNTEFAGAGRQTARDLTAGTRETAIRRLHSIKGSAGALGAMALMASASALEQALKEGATDLGRGLADLDEQLAALAEASRRFVAGPVGGTDATSPLIPPVISPATSSVNARTETAGTSAGRAPEAARPAVAAPPLDPARLESLILAIEGSDLDALAQFRDLEPALAGAWGVAGTAALGAAIADLRFENACSLIASRAGFQDRDLPDRREGANGAEAAPARRSPDRAGHAHRLGADILIVDDDRGAVRRLHHALRGMGRVRFATSGAGALALLADYPFGVVLLDANMPEMDGFATCRAVRHDYPETPVLFVTADSDFATEVRALETGAQDFITKPINPPVVRARVALHLKLRDLHVQLRNLSHLDPLTGLPNRRALDERVALEWRRTARHAQPLGLLMIDIDHFKRYNDHYGHTRGDQCLLRVARALGATAARAGDLVARYGGEEFAVLLPGNDLTGALGVAGKVLDAVRSLAIPHECSATAPHVTLSIGAASLQPVIRRDGGAPPERAPELVAGEQPEPGLYLARDLFDRADRALYAAKDSGRDRVCFGDPEDG